MKSYEPLGPPFCDELDPSADPEAPPIRCGFRPGHGGPHGWDIDGLKADGRLEGVDMTAVEETSE